MKQIAVIIAGLLVSTALGFAQNGVDRVRIGTLTCLADAVAEPTEPLQKAITCGFERLRSDTRETYEGEIRILAPDPELGPREVLVWHVWAPKGEEGLESLLGTYYRAAPGSEAVGPEEAALVGEGEQAVLLEPVVNRGTGEGPGVALAVIELELRPAQA